ncbi:MAG: glycosyltransferase [Chthoniobacteraceae bacterium]
MRILHVVDSLEPGGMENGVVNLIRGLSPEFEGHVACLTRRGAFADRLSTPERVVALGKSRGFSPLVAWRLAMQIRRVRPALLHTHNAGPLIYASLATAWGRLCPILHGEHSQLTDDEKSPRRLAQRRRFYRAARAVHCVAPAIRDELLALGCAHPDTRVVPNGVDTARFSPGDRDAARREFQLPLGARVLGIVGRFGPHKGHRALIDALAIAAGARPSLHLLIVGAGGPLEADVRECAANSPMADRIRFTGFLPEPASAYRALDLLVIPSTNEGMANAALEAMACAIPVLANTGCGHEAVIDSGRDGLLAELRSVAELTAAVESLIAEPALLCELGERARDKVCASFSIRTMMEAYAALYRALVPPA